MNSESLIIDYNKICPQEDITILKWWKSHKTIYLYLNNQEFIEGSEWDNVIKENNEIEIIIIKKEEEIINILYEKAHNGIIMITESEVIRDYIRTHSKKIDLYYKNNYPNKNANICIGDSELFENPFESVFHDTCDFYWKIDNKSFEELHKEFCEKYIYKYVI